MVQYFVSIKKFFFYKMKSLFFLSLMCIFGAFVVSNAYEFEEVGAWHFHTFFFEFKNSSVDEGLALRRTLRQLINNGTFEQCSLNQIYTLPFGPFPIPQYEMCCNKTSFNVAHSFMTQNHGNLSIYVHPLTRFDVIDHTERYSWMGEPVVMDKECPCWYPELPKPKPCPVYPEYSDELPKGPEDYQVPVPGTDDYWHLNKDFDILRDPY